MWGELERVVGSYARRYYYVVYLSLLSTVSLHLGAFSIGTGYSTTLKLALPSTLMQRTLVDNNNDNKDDDNNGDSFIDDEYRTGFGGVYIQYCYWRERPQTRDDEQPPLPKCSRIRIKSL